MKKCIDCDKKKSLKSFSTAGKGKHKPRCKPCNSAFVQNQKKTNKITYLKSKYQLMKARVEGRGDYAVTSIGKPILSLADFVWWGMASEMFLKLHDAWVLSGFDYKLSPSVDRVNSKRGYTLDNIQWLTHSENCRKDKIKA